MSIMRPEGGWNITRPPVHPGEMLREEFMKPLGISINGSLWNWAGCRSNPANFRRHVRKPLENN